MTTPTPLSPAAQAVLDAVEDHGKFSYRELAAAAMRAAADTMSLDLTPAHCIAHIRAIAAELEGVNG